VPTDRLRPRGMDGDWSKRKRFCLRRQPEVSRLTIGPSWVVPWQRPYRQVAGYTDLQLCWRGLKC
jgi:hypothetical protein